MRITVRKTGGFAGVSEELAAVDTSRLDSARAKGIEALVASAGFFALPARVAGAEGSDFFQIEVTIDDAGKRHTVTFLDDATARTAALRDLVQAIQGAR